MITEHSTIVAATELTVEDLGGGEAVVLDVESGKYYGVNEVGARILGMAAQPIRIHEVISEIQRDYEVSREQLEKDVFYFVEKLARAHLIRLGNGVG